MKNNSLGIVEKNFLKFDKPEDILELELGGKLKQYEQAYETYGNLNTEKDNAILIFHALTGDSHAAGYYSENDDKPGWWDNMIGPGKAFDTEKYFIICINVIGGCSGSTGPSSINPDTGRRYAADFPAITISDMVNAQKKIIDILGIKKLYCLAGGSMGGMLALQWMINFPGTYKSAILLATTSILSAENIAFHAIGRQAIMNDPNWNNGNYYDGQVPAGGLSVARMLGHVTYLSDEILKEKFGRKVQNTEQKSSVVNYNIYFQVESYLHYQGKKFVKRFDANSYLYITRALDCFDLTGGTGKLTPVFRNIDSRSLVVSYSSDWLFPSYMSKQIVNAMKSNNADVTYCEIRTNNGHDTFLIETERMTKLIKGFLNNA
jgi:homoserine O-acetyltransferase